MSDISHLQQYRIVKNKAIAHWLDRYECLFSVSFPVCVSRYSTHQMY